jgi:MFS family permease
MTSVADQVGPPVRARVAAFSLFWCFGLIIATWAGHLPSIKAATDASASLMGTMLLVLGAGALAAMQVAGRLVRHLGSDLVAVTGVAAMALALIPPLATSIWAVAAAEAFFLGVATGIAEVGINAVAVDIEHQYQRPIMAAFHALFSLGGVCGSLSTAAAFVANVDVLITAATVSAVVLVTTAAARAVLLRRHRPSRDVAGSGSNDPEAPVTHGRRTVLALGLMAFLLLLAEGCAMDWSSLHAQTHLGASPSSGAIALGCFVSAMTIGRLKVDHLASRTGPRAVMRWGAIASILGYVLVMTSPVLVLSWLGWSVMGLGLAGGLPQVVSATGRLGDSAGRALARVMGAGYVAFLAGPAAIGWLADSFSLNAALILPTVGLVVCACASGAVAPSRG